MFKCEVDWDYRNSNEVFIIRQVIYSTKGHIDNNLCAHTKTSKHTVCVLELHTHTQYIHRPARAPPNTVNVHTHVLNLSTYKEFVSEVSLHVSLLRVEEVANGNGHVKQLGFKQSHEPEVLGLGDWTDR